MKCLILAAGYATRLYPLTENFPKPLLKVGEKSILDWLVDDLVDTTDIDEFVVISNHKFAQHFEDWKSNKQKTRPYEITVIDDGTSTNETRLGAVKDIQLVVEKLNQLMICWLWLAIMCWILAFQSSLILPRKRILPV